MLSFRGGGFLLFVIVFPSAYLFSLFLLGFYVNGDQLHYRAFYEALGSASIREAFLLARAYIDAGEPLTILLLWSGSVSGIPKDQYISIFNAILVTQIVFVLNRYRAGLLVVMLIASNFYLVVLMTGAERLKFAYIALAAAVLFSGYVRLLFVMLSPLTHFQSLLFFPSFILARFYDEIKLLLSKGVFSKKSFFVFFAVFVFAFAFAFYLYPSLNKKAQAYFGMDRGGLELLSLVALTLVAALASKDWKRMIVLLLPCYPIIFLLGGERGNMVAVTIALWLLMVERRLNHPAVLVMLTYFSWKSVGFVRNIVLYGNGFYSG
ncbi:MAG: hypothetical protein M1440_03540 [Gammaproteobacteria bacterium]|nr:hypothetical protein [Gammaproteobacteria bacterium]